MAEGNGVDIGTVVDMLKGVIVTVGRLDAMVGRIDRDLSELRREVSVLRTDVSVLRTDMLDVRRDVSDLRQDVANYHATVFGHGILISELDERVTRVERDRPPPSRA